MGDPLAFLSTAEVGALLAVALGLAATCGPFFPSLEPGILRLEVAGRPRRAEAIVRAWEARGALGAARRSIAVDWPFIVFYSVALAALGTLAGRAGDAETAGAALAYAGVAAGLLDVVENVGLRRMLDRRFGFALVTACLACLKFVLIVAVALVALGGMGWSALAELG